MHIPKVEQMVSPRTGAPVANQFIIRDDNLIIFQSYGTTIAIKDDGDVLLNKYDWDYSRTTLKYLREFLGEDTKAIRAKIKSGEYALEVL